MRLSAGKLDYGLSHSRSICQHFIPFEMPNIVEIKIHRKPPGWTETKIERCAAFERQDSAQKRMPGDVGSNFSKPDNPFQRTDRITGLCRTPLELLKANANSVPPN
jgi:hypothetical protein